MKDTEPGRGAALAAFDRTLDRARTAPTIVDSTPALVPSRSEATTTTLCFHLDDLRVDLRLRAHGDLSSLSGLVIGDFDHVEVCLRRPEEHLRLFVRGDGAFHADRLRRGPLALTMERPDRLPVVTDWFTI
ncbi:carboxypeptidase regulatory-like domain-containing protein [Nocardiopsis sp. NPDC006832]|uniref:carboxypeptidase regulatory-like domain-containing protein n=1 Tax=Nocardiopsis sp. NPDC006832 TaxID=3157188 RepID=UPI003402470F